MRSAIEWSKTYLGIELGSTRIKAVLIGEDFSPLATGGHDWENRLENGIWTYSMEDVWAGIQASFKALAANVEEKYGDTLTTVGAIGISAMMHGYLPFDRDGKQLAAFRTWRNTMTEEASVILTRELGFNVPQRWSIAHLYQAIRNGEDHVAEIAYLTTLSGYVHWKLTGEFVLGVGEASGMLPIGGSCNFDQEMIDRFDALTADQNYPWKLREILPTVKNAGDPAGSLTAEGARLLDPTGSLAAGIPLCPPEGDAGTGMVATNSVAPRTGNVSAGTSIFAMIVLEKPLSKVYPEIDMVTTPSGSPVAMVHCNNCTTDLDAWVRLFADFSAQMGTPVKKPALYDALYQVALEGEADGGGLISYNYYSGEHLTGFEQGRPLLARLPDSRFTLANLMRTLLYSTMGTLKLGMAILEGEQVALDRLMGHGGLFKTELVGQKLMAGALGVPVAVMASAGEGGAWGIALLAAYMQAKQPGETLETFLEERVFTGQQSSRVEPEAAISAGFAAFMERYKAGLAIEKAAVENLR